MLKSMKQIETSIQSKLFDDYDKHFNPQILSSNIFNNIVENMYNISKISISPTDLLVRTILNNNPSKFVYIISNLPIIINYQIFKNDTNVYVENSINTSFFAYKNILDTINNITIQQQLDYNPNDEIIIVEYIIL